MSIYSVVAIAVIVLYLAAGLVTLLKAKWGSLVVGIFGTFVWAFSALRLAKPKSWWARRFYAEGKLGRARARSADPRYRKIVIAALAASIVVPIVLLQVSDTYRIPSPAMEETLICAQPEPGCSGNASDRVLALRYLPGTDPERGDVVFFRTPSDSANVCPAPGGLFVKRVIGLPGDEVEITSRVYVNGEPLEEPYLNQDDAGDPFGLVTVPDHSYFVMGDNRFQSCDSREFGSVPRESILSHAVFRYWPLDRLGRP
jgi:signal peptidase I